MKQLYHNITKLVVLITIKHDRSSGTMKLEPELISQPPTGEVYKTMILLPDGETLLIQTSKGLYKLLVSEVYNGQ